MREAEDNAERAENNFFHGEKTPSESKSPFHFAFRVSHVTLAVIFLLGCSTDVCRAEPAAIGVGIKDNGGVAAEPHPVGAIPPGEGANGAAAAAAHSASSLSPNADAAAGAAAVAKPGGGSLEDDVFLQSLSVSQAFVHAFVASISVIIVSELGDKTFFIAAIMAMKHARSTVFAGAIAALGIMTLLSALGGTLGR